MCQPNMTARACVILGAMIAWDSLGARESTHGRTDARDAKQAKEQLCPYARAWQLGMSEGRPGGYAKGRANSSPAAACPAGADAWSGTEGVGVGGADVDL